VVLWGVSFAATKAALRELSPVTLVFMRFALDTALLFALLLARGVSLYLEPFVTFAAAVLLLGEPVTAAVVAGGLLILGSVLLVQRAPA
jgi:drug/metabolite transporter (DMT)-like permease